MRHLTHEEVHQVSGGLEPVEICIAVACAVAALLYTAGSDAGARDRRENT